MNFIEATNNMLSGKRLIRQGWGGVYLTILNGQSYIWDVTNGSSATVNAKLYIPSVDDILANDWMVKLN